MNEIKVIGQGMNNDGAFPEATYEICLSEGSFKLLETFSLIFIAGHLAIEEKRCLSEWGSMKSIFDGRLTTIITKPKGNEVLLTQMKVKFVSFLDQSSAFLAELLMHLEKDYSYFYWMSFKEIISAESISSLNQQIHVLTKLHNMASNYWYDEKESKCIFSFDPSRKSYESVKSDVHGAINSLYIHSRLAINNILTLRNFVEETLKNNRDANEVVSLDNVQKKCDSIKNEFLSCMGCLDEVWDRAQRYCFPRLEQLNAVPPIFVNSKEIENFSDDRISILGLSDNVPVDEVFEATVGEESINVAYLEENDIWLSNIRKDKITRRKQMERCRRVLQEIQPILQQRREMWEEREQVAMQRKNEKKYDDDSVCQANSKNFTTNEMEEVGDHIEEIPLVIPFSGIGTIKNEECVYDIKNKCFQRDEDDDYDSDEERLKVYRRVKQELYEDELRRLAEDKEEEEDICNQESKYFFTMDCADNDVKNMCSCHNDVCGCKGRSVGAIIDRTHGSWVDRNEIKNTFWKPVNQTKSLGSNFEFHATGNEIKNDADSGESSLSSLSSPSSISAGVCVSGSSLDGLTSSLISPSLTSSLPLSLMDSPISEKDFQSSQIYDISIPNSASIVAQSFPDEKITTEKKVLLHTKNYLNENDFFGDSCENLEDEFASNYTSSETYTCGNEYSDCDNHSIDWSTCGFPSSKNLRSEDRFMPDHDGWLSCGSLNPFLASETLQGNPALQKFNLIEEVFGGVGECEDEHQEIDSNCK